MRLDESYQTIARVAGPDARIIGGGPLHDDSDHVEEVRMAKARRTTHRSSTGTTLYAVRDSSGKFKDIQTYKRAHGADIKKSSGTERVAARKKAAKKG